MTAECIKYLGDRIKAAMGAETVVLSTQKELLKFADSHVGAVLLEQDALQRADIRAGPGDGRKLYTRALLFSVVLGEYSVEALDPCYCTFLASLGRGFTLPDGHGVVIEVGTAEWVQKEDSILLAKVAAILPITMSGGIYTTIPRAQFRDVNITTKIGG